MPCPVLVNPSFRHITSIDTTLPFETLMGNLYHKDNQRSLNYDIKSLKDIISYPIQGRHVLATNWSMLQTRHL